MSIDMTIRSGTTRTFPQQGDSDLYGEVTSWANDVTSAINASPTTDETATYDAIVGSAANVTAGIATHSDISTAIAAVSANDRIYILENTYEPAAQINIDKALTIIGQGEGVDIQGDNIATGAVVQISASGVTLENIKITQGTGTPDYALEIAAAMQRIYLNIKADGTFATDLFLNGSVAGAITGFISYDNNSVLFAGESIEVEQIKIEDQTTAAYDLIIESDSDTDVLAADRTLTFDVHNANRLIDMKGDLTISNDLITVGDDSVTLTTSAATDVTLPTTGTLATLDGVEALTNKTITAPDINGGTADSLTGFSIRSSGAAFDLELDTAEVLTGNKIISLNVADTNRSVTLEGDLDLTGNFSTVGDDAVTLTTTADTNVTLPTTGTLSTLDGGETLTNKVLTAPDINGGTADELTSLSIRSSGAAFDLEFDTAEVLTGDHIVSWNVGDGDRTVTLNENFTIGDGANVTIVAEDADSTITLDEQTFEVEGEGTASQLTKIVNANNAAATITLEGTSSVINQDVTSDADVNFTTVTCVTDIDTPLVTNDSADLTVSTTTSGNINLNSVDETVIVSSGSATNATTQTVKFGDDTGGISGIRNLSGELQYNSGGAGWTAFNSEGGINYITNGGAEVDTTGWATYADAAGAVPVDGTGGAPTLTWTRDTTTPLRGAGEFLVTKDAADRQGEGASYDFTIDVADIHSVLSITFDCTTSANYVDDDMIVYIYNVDSSRLIEPVSRGIKAGEYGRYFAQFQTDATDTSYRLIFHVSTVNAAAYTLNIDNVKIGPSVVNFGAPITDWSADFDMTLNSNTNVTSRAGNWRRVGDSLHFKGLVAFGGAGDNSTFTFDLPSGLAMDPLRINYATATSIGSGTWWDTGTAQKLLTIIPLSASQFTASIDTGTSYVNTNLCANGDYIAFWIEVPILGWGSAVQMSDRDETRLVAARYTNANADEMTNTTQEVICYDTKVFDTHNAVSFTNFATQDWKFYAPCSGTYFLNASATIGQTYDAVAGAYWQFKVLKNGAAVKVKIQTHVDAESNIYYGVEVSDTVYLDKNDYLSVSLQQNSGGNHNLNADATMNVISIHRLSGPSAIAANELVAARYDTDAGQSIDNASAEIVNFDSTTFGYDTHGSVTTGAAWKFTAPVSGKYHVSSGVFLQSNAGWAIGEVASSNIYKNGSLNALVDRLAIQTTGTLAVTLYGSVTVDLNEGDYIDLRVYQDSGGAISMQATEEYNFISIERIGF